LNSGPPIKFGPYTLYSVNNHINNILSKYPDHGGNDILNNEIKRLPNILISVVFQAKSAERATEFADGYFSRFEYIISYMIGRNKKYDVGVFDYHGWKVNEVLSVSGANFSSGGHGTGAILSIDLADAYFTEISNGNSRIWDIVGHIKNGVVGELEKRMLAAIEWIGKANKDEKEVNSYAQYVFALEALLLINHQGIITPSIASQISENAAFIIGTNVESRCSVESMVKDVYSKRSAIVHGGSMHVETEDLVRAINIMYGLTRNLLIRNELTGLITMKRNIHTGKYHQAICHYVQLY
jgi:hypothetical protein